MKRLTLLLATFAFLNSCIDDTSVNAPDPSLGVSAIQIGASATEVPYFAHTAIDLEAYTDGWTNVTEETQFFVDGEPIAGHIFKPDGIGEYMVHGVFWQIESDPILVSVVEPRNKKVIVELFTSKLCGWCPWIADRIDSLDKASNAVIGYTIHGFDELEIEKTSEYEDFLEVYGRPSISVDRARLTYPNPISNNRGLLDSVNAFLSTLPELELSVRTSLSSDQLEVEVFGKFYEEIEQDIFLTAIIVENNIVTHGQYNYFSGWYDGSPFKDKPDPIPDYVNHNVLRQFLTDLEGDELRRDEIVVGKETALASFSDSINKVDNIDEAFVIVFVHYRRDDMTAKSILNAQIVKLGDDVDYDE